MEIMLLKSDVDYEKALARLESLMDAEPGTPEEVELKILSLVIQDYEEKEIIPQFETLDPVDAIEAAMEERDLEKKDLTELFGDRSLVTKILNRKRKLSLSHIRKLHEELDIPYQLLISDYNIPSQEKA